MLDDRPTPSSTDNDAPVWDSVSNDASWKLYLGDYYGSQAVPAYAAPSRETDFTGLPPACAFVGSADPFHDEVETYMENLKKGGVPIHFKAFNGGFHAFERMCANTTIAKEAIAFYMEAYDFAVNNYFAP